MNKRQKHVWFLVFIFLVLSLVFLGLWFEVGQYINFATLENILEPFGAFAPVAFILIQTLVVALLIPGSPITIAGGVIFTPLLGILYSVVASTLGASLIFLVARKLGSGFLHDWLERKNQKYIKYLKKAEKKGFLLTTFLRVIPIVPFHALSIVLGLTHIRFRDFLLGTLLGVIPSTAIFVFLGSNILAQDAQFFSLSGSVIIIIWLILIGLGSHFKHLLK